VVAVVADGALTQERRTVPTAEAEGQTRVVRVRRQVVGAWPTERHPDLGGRWGVLAQHARRHQTIRPGSVMPEHIPS
jgi:hypothetical protein